MTDFLLELLSEEIPARMQEKAAADLARLFGEALAKSGLAAERIETFVTPRRLALVAYGLPDETAAVSEETKGPKASAPPQALEGFLRKTGLSREQLTTRDGILFATVEKPGRRTADVIAEAVPAIVRGFPWPKSMRWGAASASTESLRWVRPLQGIVALLGGEVVPFAIAGVTAGRTTVGHRFHHPGAVTIPSTDAYAGVLHAAHVIVDAEERRRIVRGGAKEAATAAGFALVPDEGLVAENAGLTEWPMPLLGRFDPAFLEVPREVIQLTMRTNQKYFACVDAAGELAPAFVCTANIAASDGGAAIVAGNARVLAARLADAKFFWEQDLKTPLAEQAEKLEGIVFHEKLGTVADKVERVAKLARWLVEEGVIPLPAGEGKGPLAPASGKGEALASGEEPHPPAAGAAPPLSQGRGAWADLAETAARLCKADLVTAMVGEFPELQGVMGGYYARAQGYPDEVADAIRDHYKPVGQGDEVPTAPVTVAVSLADKLDTIGAFFAIGEQPTGSRDPFAIRRSGLGILRLLENNGLRLPLLLALTEERQEALREDVYHVFRQTGAEALGSDLVADPNRRIEWFGDGPHLMIGDDDLGLTSAELVQALVDHDDMMDKHFWTSPSSIIEFFADRLKVQQREAGVRHDLIDAVFALGGEDDLVRLLARVRALQAFVGTEDGANLLAGYKRAANILKKEGWGSADHANRHPGLVPGSTAPQTEAPEEAWMPEQVRHDDLGYTAEPAESALIAALDAAEPAAETAVAAEDFAGAMTVLAALRAPIDAFFDQVTVNDSDPAKRAARLDLLVRIRDAVHRVADFSKIEG